GSRSCVSTGRRCACCRASCARFAAATTASCPASAGCSRTTAFAWSGRTRSRPRSWRRRARLRAAPPPRPAAPPSAPPPARALALLAAIGPYDVGQGAVIADGHVLAIEAAEGTDRMLERVAALRGAGRVHSAAGIGVLVKAPKPAQDRRFDLPSIGPQTIEGVARAGLAGLAVVAGATIVAEADRVARLADAHGLFVVGVPAREERR